MRSHYGKSHSVRTVVKPLANGCIDQLEWNELEVSEKVKVNGPNNSIAIFHPLWSNGTAAIRSSKPINRNRSKCYWEVTVKDRLFGTSMMIGVCTRTARLQCDSFINLIGEDEHGWGLSHKGLLWHNGQWRIYTQPFRENQTTVIGCLYDGLVGTLTFYKDGVNLGVAFTNLHLIDDDLYPCVSSTAAKTQFILSGFRRESCNLQECCRAVIRQHADNSEISNFPLPPWLISFLKMEDDTGSEYIVQYAQETPKRFKPFTIQSYTCESNVSSAATVTVSASTSASISSSSSSRSSSSSGPVPTTTIFLSGSPSGGYRADKIVTHEV